MKSKKPTIVGSKVVKKKRNKSRVVKLILLFIVILAVIFFLLLFHRIRVLNNVNEHIDSLDKEYIELEDQVKEKENQAKDVDSDDYIMEKARDELKLVFPNEKIIVVPDKD